MHPIFATICDEFAAELTALDSGQTQRRPAGRPDAWSMQEIVGHLLLTYESTAQAMDARLAKGTPTQARAFLPARVAQFGITRLGIFPTGRKAPERVQPQADAEPLDGKQLVHAMTKRLESLDAKLVEVGKRFGRGRSVNHMVLGPLSVAQWRRFHRAHARHHLKQIVAIRGQR